MDKAKIGYLVLIAMIIIVAGILYLENNRGAETVEKPTPEDLYRDPATIGQDMTPDGRIDEETGRSGEIKEPNLIPDLSYEMSRDEIEDPNGFEIYGIYTGTLPCADCAGIDTELRLLNDPASGRRRYVLKQTYKSTREGDQVFWESGAWRTAKNEQDQPTFLLLKDEKDQPGIFIEATERVIRLADQQGNLIESELNYSLYRLPK
ncbi:MAG TPA: hypothetical protein DCE78_09680 [Bacteroidetes bacterium]|nr:hypothetical protein [Bacteroidota bacterium]